MKTLNEIRERIRTINPTFTDELLDLLYEYMFVKYLNDYKEKIGTDDLKDIIDYVLNPINYVKDEQN
jgi:hypothetical protein